MPNLNNPSPQWTEPTVSAALASRLVPFLDPSGFWVLRDAGVPSGAFVADPGGSGYTIIDNTITSGLRPTLLPSGVVVIY